MDILVLDRLTTVSLQGRRLSGQTAVGMRLVMHERVQIRSACGSGTACVERSLDDLMSTSAAQSETTALCSTQDDL